MYKLPLPLEYITFFFIFGFTSSIRTIGVCVFVCARVQRLYSNIISVVGPKQKIENGF